MDKLPKSSLALTSKLKCLSITTHLVHVPTQLGAEKDLAQAMCKQILHKYSYTTKTIKPHSCKLVVIPNKQKNQFYTKSRQKI